MKKKPLTNLKRTRAGTKAKIRAERSFTVVIEEDEDGSLIASVPALPGCFTQGRSLKQIDERIKEAIGAYLDAFPDSVGTADSTAFVALRRVAV